MALELMLFQQIYNLACFTVETISRIAQLVIVGIVLTGGAHRHALVIVGGELIAGNGLEVLKIFQRVYKLFLGVLNALCGAQCGVFFEALPVLGSALRLLLCIYAADVPPIFTTANLGRPLIVQLQMLLGHIFRAPSYGIICFIQIFNGNKGKARHVVRPFADFNTVLLFEVFIKFIQF